MPYSQPVDSGNAGDYSSLPGEHVTVDQVVAVNVRYWRKAAGLTQKELGERIGWSHANLSAAERSAVEGKDKRRFDAHTLAALAKVLGVPIAALFLPPPDDGISKRYLFHAEPGECSQMSELATMLISDPVGDDTPVMNAYRERYLAMIMTYGDEERGGELMAHAGDLTTAAKRADRLERLRWQREALAALVSDIDRIADAIADAGSSDG